MSSQPQPPEPLMTQTQELGGAHARGKARAVRQGQGRAQGRAMRFSHCLQELKLLLWPGCSCASISAF